MTIFFKTKRQPSYFNYSQESTVLFRSHTFKLAIDLVKLDIWTKA